MQIPNDFDNQSQEARAIRIPVQTAYILIAILATAIGAFVAGYVVANVSNNARMPTAMTTFWDAWQLADKEFYYNKPSETDRVYGAIRGMMESYGDKYTLFLPPEPAANDQQLMQGEVGGIGVRISPDQDGNWVVTEALVDKPAVQAGVKTGDVIVAVNGKDVKGMANADLVPLLRGTIGTSVTLTLRRANVPDPVTVTITRGQINTSARMLTHNIAYASLSLFNQTSSADLRAEIDQLLKNNPAGLILDLRSNPGGDLQQSIKVADLFLPDGLVVTEKTSDGDVVNFQSHTDNIPEEQIKLVVLVDNFSASASEIVAGALQDRKRAVLIGTKTYGKGSVQIVHSLSDGSQLRVTHGAWYTPDGRALQQPDAKPIGLTPDILVTVPTTPVPGKDPILDAAIAYLYPPDF